MIFKTITSSVDETRKTIALFNKDWNTYKTNWQNSNGVFGKIGSVFSTARSPLSSNDIEAIKAYNSQIDACTTSQTAFNRTMLNASPAAQNLVASFNGGKVSAQAMANAQNAAKASTIGLTIAQTALNAAIGMGIGLLISAVINGVNKLIHANEEAIEKAEELRRNYDEFKTTNQENVKTLEGLDEEFRELSKGVSQYGDNISLTTEQYQRYKEIIQQIVGMSPSLAEGYSTENGYIADKNSLLERAIELQEKEYRNELRKVTNLDSLKTSMSGYIAEYKESFNGGLVTDDMSATATREFTNLKKNLYQAFNINDRNDFSSKDMITEIMKSIGVQNIEDELSKYSNEFGDYLTEDFLNDYADIIAENIQAVLDSLNADDVGLNNIIFDQIIEKTDSAAQSYLDMKDAISLANESIQTDLGYIAEYADGYSNLSTEQQKFIAEYLKGFNISDIMSKSANPIVGWHFDEDKMASVKSQITKFVEKLSQNESTKKALTDLYAIPTDAQSVTDFVSQFRNALEIIKSYCKENGIEVPIAISDDEKAINDLEEQYQRTIDFTEDKFSGYNATNFFTNNSINTQEEIDKWLEIAQAANSASEAEKQYLNQDVDSSLLSLEEAQKAVNGFKEGDTEIIGLIEEYELLQEVLSDTGNIQEETYEKLLSCSSKYSTAIRTENGRITVNTSKLKVVAKSRQLDTKEAIKQTLALKKQEWVQWNNDIENYNGTLLDSITINYENIDALQQQITQYELLANSLDNTSSAFENFKNAQSTEDQDMYNTAQDAFDVLKGYSSDPENENFGKYNRDEFQEAAMLLMDNDTYKKALNAKDLDEYQKIVDNFVKSVEPLFDEKNYNSAKNLFDRINEIMDSGNVPEADIDWAKRLGISKEMFHALSQFGDQYDFNHKEIFESYQLNTLDEYQSLLSNVKTAQEALNECTEKTGNKYDYLSMELDEAKRKYSEFKNETTDTIESAYADFTHSGAKSKGDFAEYLKQNLDFDDSDVTGSIDVLLDKSKSLQENLANIHPDSAAYELYKKQLDDVNSLLDSLNFDINSIDKTKSLEDKISQYKELVKEAEGYKRTLETDDSGSDAYKEAVQELERISGLMGELRDPLKLEISSNISEIDSQISQLDEKLNGLKESLKHASSSGDAYSIHMDMKGVENEKAKLEGQKEELQQTLKIIVDSTEVDEYDPEEKEGTVKYSPDFTNVTNAEPPVLKGTIEYEAKLPNQPTIPTSPTTKANGTFNAFAQGTGSDVSIRKDEKALVNELGEEGVVRNGKLIPIKGGAQFVNLKRGDIIFNHKQMQQLKKNGYTTGRGKLIGAHADGTMNAYDTGTRINLPNLKDVTTNNKAIQHAKNSSKEIDKTVKEATEDTKESFEEVFDWIENRVKKFQRLFDKWIKQAETAVTSGFITKYYKKATSAIKKELSTYGKAYSRYMKEANAVGLDERYAKKVRNGTIDIEAIRAEGSKEDVAKYEELADKIQKYQEYYNKAIESTTSFVETAEELYSLPLDKAATKIDKFKDAIDLLDKKLDNAIGSKAKNSLVDKQTKQEKKTLDAEKIAKKESKSALKSAGKALTKKSTLDSPDVSKKEKKKIKEAVKGDKEVSLSYFKEGSKAYNAAVKYNEALKANKQATYDCAAAQEEYNSWLVEASKIKFDNIADDYDKRVQMLGYQMTALDNQISEIETAGKKVNKPYYEAQKNINVQNLAQYKAEKSALEESIKTIKKGTDEWYEAYDKIQQVSSSISDCVKETYELNNAINQLHFDLFEDISESIGRIITEQEFLQGLFAHEKTTDDKTGNFTEAGLAKLGSLSASYYAADNDAKRYASEVAELRRMYESGSLHSDLLGITMNSMDDLKARLDETVAKEQDAFKIRYDLQTKLHDLMEEQCRAETDFLKDLIDAKKEALNAEKDLHDYNKTLNEKTENISTIKKQIAAYSGDTSEEGMAKLQKLQKELADREEDLRETEYDRYISDQQDMLDKLYQEYGELMTKKLDDFMGLVREGLEKADDNTALISDYMSKVAGANGYTEETKGLFSGLGAGIKSDVDRAIDAIAKSETSRSGTENETDGGTGNETLKTGLIHPQDIFTDASHLSETQPSRGDVMPSDILYSSSPSSNEKDLRETAKKYISGHASKAKKKKNEYSDVNQKIYEDKSNSYKGTGKILSSDELKGLAKVLNVKYDNASKTGKLYKKLKSIKFPGFKKGGIVSVDDIEKQVKDNGDTSLVSVQSGEALLTPVQTDLFKKFTEHMPEMMDQTARMADFVKIDNPLEHLKQLSDMRSMGNTVNIDMGGITMNGVNDPQQFADQMVRSFQKYPKVRKAVNAIESDRLMGGGRLGVNMIR